MWDLAPVLKGELVVLAPLAPAHYAEMYDASRHPEIWTWWPLDLGVDELTFRRWFDGALHTGVQGIASHFALFDARDGRIVGSASFCQLRPEHRGIEIGWTWLTPRVWGLGFNHEAQLLQMRYAFETLGCIRVSFEADEQNVRSRRSLEAFPATLEGIWREWRIVGEQRRSSAFYSILDSEWPTVRANGEARRTARSRND